jgi:hypothetical protein
MQAGTILLRQVHPDFFQEGHISSMAFRPTNKDTGLLSLYDGEQIDPPQSWTHYTEKLGFRSAGVWGITHGEAGECELECRPEASLFKEHVVIDFTKCSRKQIRDKAKQLAAKAEQRGCLFTPPLSE